MNQEDKTMNQSHSRSRAESRGPSGAGRAEGRAPIQRLGQQLEGYSRLSDIQKILSPYWAARSETEGFGGFMEPRSREEL